MTTRSGVYEIRNKVTGKSYIGSAAVSFRRRWGVHLSLLGSGKHGNPKLQHSWNKHGADAFEFRILLVCAPKDCLFFEQRAIDAYNAVKEGYNLLPIAGSPLGTKHSEESKRKISAGNRGRVCTDSTRAALSKVHKGKVISLEQRKALSDRNKGVPKSPEQRAKMAEAGRGRVHSPETKAKIGAASQGRTFTDEQREKISAGVLRAYATTDLREKVARASRGREVSPAALEALNWTGRRHTPESKKKIGEASASRKHSPETRAKIAAALSGRTRGPYKKRDVKASTKPATSNSYNNGSVPPTSPPEDQYGNHE